MRKGAKIMQQTLEAEKNEVVQTTIKRAERHNAYRVMRDFVFKGEHYRTGETIEATGKDLSFLIKNSLIQ